MINMVEEFDKAKAEKYVSDSGILNVVVQQVPRKPEILPNGSVMFSGIVGYDITLDAIKPYLNTPSQIITDSIGGSLFEAYRIRDYIKTIAPDTVIGVVGYCASAATVMLLGAKRENRWSSENSRFLIHYPTNKSAGDASTLFSDAAQLKKEEDAIVEMYSVEFGKSIEEIRAIMHPEKIMNPVEAKQLGLIGEIKGNGESTKGEEPIINNNENEKKEEMEKAEAKKALNMLAKAFNDIKSFFGPSNLVLQDVTGVELDFGPDVTSEEQIVVGITGVTANGAAAEGDYVMPDGRTMKFTAGELMEIMPAQEDNQVEQLTAENNALKEEVANLKKENGILAQKNTEAFAKVKNIETEFNKFKNEFSQEDKIEHDAPPAAANGGENKKQFVYNGKKRK